MAKVGECCLGGAASQIPTLELERRQLIPHVRFQVPFSGVGKSSEIRLRMYGPPLWLLK